MSDMTYGPGHPTVTPMVGHRSALFRQQLGALLPAGARVEVARHPDVDTQASIALTISLPARPNRLLPGRNRPESAPFTIEISRRLLQRHVDPVSTRSREESGLAAWVQAHVAGAAPPANTHPHEAAPLLWRFTASSTNAQDICTQRLDTASAA